MAKVTDWGELDSCTEGDSVSLSGVAVTAGVGTLAESGEEAQVLTIEELGESVRQLLLVVPIVGGGFSVDEVLRFDGRVFTRRDEVVVVHSDASEVCMGSDS